MPEQIQVQGIYAYLDDLLAVLLALQQEGHEILAVHSPVPSHEITAAMRVKASPIRYITLTGAILGIAVGFGLAIYTAWQWKFIVSGKPPVPTVPYVIEGFEFCILLAVIFNVGGLWLLTRLPRLTLPGYYDPRVTEDRFSVLVRCPEVLHGTISRLLRDHGAEEVNVVS